METRRSICWKLTNNYKTISFGLKYFEEDLIIINIQYSVVHQNLARVTSFRDLKSPSLKLVTPSLNYTPMSILKSRDSKLVTLICTFLRKSTFISISSVNFILAYYVKIIKLNAFGQI